MKHGIGARGLRIVLILVVLLTLVIIGLSLSFALSKLKAFASETSTLTAKNNSSNTTLKNLRDLQTYLNTHSQDIERAKGVVSSEESYAYQDDFVRELTQLADQSDVDITQFDFTSAAGASNGAAGTSGSTTPAPAAGATTAPAAGAAPATGSGLKSVTCNVTLKSPLPYKKFITFLKRIELNPKRMQVTSVSLTGNGNSITSEYIATKQLEIKVYLK